MVFVDGMGIGRRDPSVNPVFGAKLPAFRSLFDGELPSLHRRRLESRNATLLPIDATLGVAGLPQSGTGQTALFTGVNAPRLVGKHFGPYPYSSLRPILEERNLLRRILEGGKTACFANAFPQRFFDYASQKRARLTVTTLSCQYSGLQLLRAEHLREGRAISADITNAGWRALGYPDMEVIEPAEAGRRLARLTRSNDFVLFEYWKTDHAGHSLNMNEAVDVLEKLDGLLVGILEGVDPRDTLLILTSDHGNIEDMSTKTHTRNPVPVVLYGAGHSTFAAQLEAARQSPPNLTHIYPLVLDRVLA